MIVVVIVENGGFVASPERTQGTYSKYNSIDDKIDDFHYFTTFIKFGIGRTTYDAAQEIRNNEIDRNEAIALIKKFDGEYPDRFESEIFQYLSVPESEYPVASKMFQHRETCAARARASERSDLRCSPVLPRCLKIFSRTPKCFQAAPKYSKMLLRCFQDETPSQS